MGCAVNGPGEAREADYGVACGKGEGLLIAGGKQLKKVPELRYIYAIPANQMAITPGLYQQNAGY